METPILYQVEDGVATITLNRPERLNAMNPQLFAELVQRLEEAQLDGSVRVLVLTGAGRGFSSGGDIVGHPTFEDPKVQSRNIHIAAAHDVIRKVATLPKPTIAAVNGVAAGAGADLVWACDFRIAAAEAKFVEAFVNIGLMPDFGGSYFLPRLVGTARAKEIIMLGEPFSADQALQWGLVNQVVPGAELKGAVMILARKLAAKAPMALSLIKEAVDSASAKSLDTALSFERIGQNMLLGTPELREKANAFRDKSHSKA